MNPTLPFLIERKANGKKEAVRSTYWSEKGSSGFVFSLRATDTNVAYKVAPELMIVSIAVVVAPLEHVMR